MNTGGTILPCTSGRKDGPRELRWWHKALILGGLIAEIAFLSPEDARAQTHRVHIAETFSHHERQKIILAATEWKAGGMSIGIVESRTEATSFVTRGTGQPFRAGIGVVKGGLIQTLGTPGRWTLILWPNTPCPLERLAAHEFGHMLGLLEHTERGTMAAVCRDEGPLVDGWSLHAVYRALQARGAMEEIAPAFSRIGVRP